MQDAATLLLLAFLVHTSFAQYSRGTRVEVNNGIRTAWWSEKAGAKSTSIVTLDPAPTLWYNCRYGKSICNNVEKTHPGANAGTLEMELVYDTDKSRADARRTGKKGSPGSGMCPGTWKDRHTCPEPDQPEIWLSDVSRDRADDDDKPYLKLPNSLKYPSGKQQVLNKQKQPTLKTNYQIADFNGRPSGLMYTCDEFPFASTIQGGSGLDGDANAGLSFAGTTYCAPQSSSCAKNTEWFDAWAIKFDEEAALYKKLKNGKGSQDALRRFRSETGFEFPQSDQDVQADALNKLSTIFRKHKKGLYSYQFKTRYNDDDVMADVEYEDPASNDKRDVHIKHVYAIFLNGTSSHRIFSSPKNRSRNHHNIRDNYNNTKSTQNATFPASRFLTSSLIQTITTGGNLTSTSFPKPSGFITSKLSALSNIVLANSSLSTERLNTMATSSIFNVTETESSTTEASETSSLLSASTDGNGTSISLVSALTDMSKVSAATTSDKDQDTFLTFKASSSTNDLISDSKQTSSTSPTSSAVNGSYITLSDVWEVSSPVVNCTAVPCLVILPPYTLPTPTTIIRESVTEDGKTVTFPPFTTDRVEWSRITINDSSETVNPVMSIEEPFDIGPPITIDLPSLPHIHVVGVKPTPKSIVTPEPSSKPTSTKPSDRTEMATSATDATTKSVVTSAATTETASIIPVPPPGDDDNGDDDDDDDDDDEDEDDEEEEEEEEGEDCVVPGWDISDFPIGGETFDDDAGQDSAASTSLESSAVSTTSTDAAATTTSMSSILSTKASKTTSIGTATCNSAPVATETDGTYEVSIEFAEKAVNDFCQSMQSQGKIFAPGQNTSSGDLYFPNGQSGAIRSGNPVQLSAKWNGDDDTDCPTLDLSSSNAMDTCKTILASIYSSCSNTFISVPVTWGGTLYQACIDWELQPVEDNTSLDG